MPTPGPARRDPDRFGERGDALRAAIMALPKYERLVVTLIYFEDLEEPEVARILELDAATVATLRASALRRIRARLQ